MFMCLCGVLLTGSVCGAAGLRTMVPTGVSTSAPSTFKWTRASGATRYRVKLAKYDYPSESYLLALKVWIQQPLSGTPKWRPPVGSIKPGSYRWTVTDYAGATKGRTSLAFFSVSKPPMTVAGVITNDVTWKGEVLVTDTVEIAPGATLTILAGTKVRFQHYRGYRDPEKRLSLQVRGAIVAVGTTNQPITFTSDAANPQNGDWSMLRLISPTGQCRFQCCRFEFAQHGLNVWDASPEITQCVFRWNNWEGVYFESYCNPVFDRCQIYQNGYNGLATEQSNDILMDRCEIWSNGTHGVHADNSIVEIRQSRIHHNGSSGLSVDNNGTMRALGDAICSNRDFAIAVGDGINTVQIGNLEMAGNGGEIGGGYSVTNTAFEAPESVDIGFAPDQSQALGYTPGDQALDRYLYVYPNDETRCITNKIGAGLGLTWSLAWDGTNLWTCTLWGHVSKLDPETGSVLEDFDVTGSPIWGAPTQPWGMTFDDEGFIWLVDFAERKVFKINPATHTVLFSFATPDPLAGGCKGLAWDGQYLNVMGWVTPVIYRMSKAGALIETVSLDNGGGGGLTWDGAHFWVPAGGRIFKYDALGQACGWIYAASEGTWDLAWDGVCLWATQRTNENWPDAKIFRLAILDDHDSP